MKIIPVHLQRAKSREPFSLYKAQFIIYIREHNSVRALARLSATMPGCAYFEALDSSKPLQIASSLTFVTTFAKAFYVGFAIT